VHHTFTDINITRIYRTIAKNTQCPLRSITDTPCLLLRPFALEKWQHQQQQKQYTYTGRLWWPDGAKQVFKSKLRRGGVTTRKPCDVWVVLENGEILDGINR